MTFEEARQAIGEAFAATPRPQEKYTPQWHRYRALWCENMLLSSLPAWPLLTPAQRQSIIDDDFRVGRYPEPGEGDPRPLVAARRAPLWTGLLADERWAIRDARHYRPRQLRRPMLRLSPAQLLDLLVAGEIWAWCCEGWVIPRYDILRAAER